MTEDRRAQLVITSDTKEKRHITRIYDRDIAEQMLAVIKNAMRVDGQAGATATVSFETFRGDGARITMRGAIILGVELIPIDPKHTATYRPGPDAPLVAPKSYDIHDLGPLMAQINRDPEAP